MTIAVNATPARLEEQLRSTFEGPAWHGPAVLDVLVGLTALQANARPIPSAHTIWELVLHLGGSYRLVLRRLQGDGRQLSPDEDWPSVPEPTDEHWHLTVIELRALNDAARRAVADFPEDRLHLPI